MTLDPLPISIPRMDSHHEMLSSWRSDELFLAIGDIYHQVILADLKLRERMLESPLSLIAEGRSTGII
jgi:hypothetical protein